MWSNPLELGLQYKFGMVKTEDNRLAIQIGNGMLRHKFCPVTVF